jgi:hypothetical protein
MLLQSKTVTSRISEACNNVLINDLQGFCRYSTSKFDNYLNKQSKQPLKIGTHCAKKKTVLT